MPFSARIRRVAAGRAIKPWTEKLGIPAGTRARMLKGDGIPPTYETLARLMRVEGVSISWLLGASTPPYLVYRPSDDVETSTQLQALLGEEESWRAALITDGERGVIVLHQPAEIELRSRSLRYTATELIAGPIGERSLAQLGTRLDQVVKLGRDDLADIYHGSVGTYHLVGDDQVAGYIDPVARSIEAPYAIENVAVHSLRVAEGTPATPDLPRALAPLVRWWPHLSEPERNAVTTLLDPMIEGAARRLRGA